MEETLLAYAAAIGAIQPHFVNVLKLWTSQIKKIEARKSVNTLISAAIGISAAFILCSLENCTLPIMQILFLGLGINGFSNLSHRATKAMNGKKE